MRALVTGGAGFIGSAVVERLLGEDGAEVVNVDKLVYPGSAATVERFAGNARHHFHQLDIRDAGALRRLLETHRPQALIHLAAESHVDRSIDRPADFIETNVVGTSAVLGAALSYHEQLAGADRDRFRLVHVSTDEVYGSLGPQDPAFTEASRYDPRSPYAASKAASDHLARAWHHTFDLPVVTSNCTNNYGPYQFPEKLIPLIIARAIAREPLPVYGRGENVRDWLHVDDHARALVLLAERGRPGESYNIGGRCERANLAVVHGICAALDALRPVGAPHAELIAFVADRPGHDFRYAMAPEKIERELGWRAERDFDTGLRETVAWYLDNQGWCRAVTRDTDAGERLGLRAASGDD